MNLLKRIGRTVKENPRKTIGAVVAVVAIFNPKAASVLDVVLQMLAGN